MNGQYAIKGYLFQSLVALLDSFKADWETVCVEHNDESEKVDILWTYKEGNKKVVQVKSSQNPFSFSSANKWANELTVKSPDADKYELILVGHIDSKLQKLKDGIIDKVVVINKVLEINDFEAIILAKINSFFEKKGKNNISPKLGNYLCKH